MRAFNAMFIGFALILISPFIYSQTTNQLVQEQMQRNSGGSKDLPPGISSNWYEAAIKNLNEREYQLTPLDVPNQFGAFNRKQQLGFRFTAEGYDIKGLDTGQDLATLWEASFELQGAGRNHTVSLPAIGARADHQPDRLQYHYKGFDVEYLNAGEGMRQNFIIHRRPSGRGELKVWMNIHSDLIPKLSADNRLLFHKKDDELTVQLIYDELKVWDANHRLLPARLQLSGNGKLTIAVDDRKAKYPITIDPLNHTPDWTDNGQGLLFPVLNDLTAHLLYGFTVSGAGDVNNDTFDDIIIGAPAFVDIINISGGTFNAVSVGAAFIYYGSAGGPSLTPTEALQPVAFAGALFGFSVSSAGDINNDGADDIVIGAPGDHVDLNVGLGVVSASVGRVYVYYGNTFDGNVNTEPVVSVTVNLTQPDFGILAATPANPLYGFSVSNAGDVNNDGFDDIVVGSPAYINLVGLTLGGCVDVYRGSLAGLNTTPHRTTGSLIGGLFGYSVSTAGQVNNDLFDDIIVGAPASIGLVAVGSAYIFHGSGTGITASSVAGANTTLQAPGLLSQTLFGYSVSHAGDVNGDTRGDVIVGEPLSLEQTLSLQLVAVGKAHIYYGSNTGIVTGGSTQLTSPRRPNLLGLVQGNLLFGFSVSTAGDVNCDGLGDVIVGEPGGTSISLGVGVLGLVSANALSGKAYVFYGRNTSGPINSPSFIVQETGALSVANLLGASVSDAGNINGNGGALLIGAPNGTMNFASSITGIIGSALGIVTQNSVGSAYSYFACLSAIDLDFDNDGIPDAVDLDDDNDGTTDMAEYPGMALTQDPAGDADGDGIPNYKDADFTGCGGLNGAGTCTSFDKDGDGVPNSFDLDADNDGIPDVIENGGVDTNGDGILDNVTDTDGDGLAQSIDANNTGAAGSGVGLTPADFDADGIPNSQDIDSDGDGVSDLREAGLPDADNNALVDGAVDADGDGFSDAVDPKQGHSGASDPAGTGVAALVTPTDTNNDGRYNGNPTTGNSDSDAVYNFIDIDSDNDGITDNVEAQSTTGYTLPSAADTDGDGLANIYDSQGGIYTAGGITPNNQDLADNPDYLDTDTDNDGLADIVEGHDINGNGEPDDNVTPTGIDTDVDGLDNRFDIAVGPNGTTQGIGNPPTPGSTGPLQASQGLERDWRNGNFVLPLKLVGFSARQINTGIELKWSTENEQNFSHFEIERSADGRTYVSLGKVDARGLPDRKTDYLFSDRQPLPRANYYRLKMVDKDSHFKYSNVLLLTTGNEQKGIGAYPNPVKEQLQLVWQQMPNAPYTVDMINAGGQLVKRYRIDISSINQVVLIERDANWKAGVYLLRIVNTRDQSITTKRIVIQ